MRRKFLRFQMTEEDIYRLFETAYESFDREGDTPETEELIQKALYAAADAGFSAEEIEAINAQILLKNQDVENGYSAMARKLAEYHLRRTARNTIQMGGSVEDYLADANACYDKFLEEEKQRNPAFDDNEARVQSSLMRQMARNIWFEELLRE
jgi:hypothetical protein